jgi:DNA-binding PadR family transcriptional regulator
MGKSDIGMPEAAFHILVALAGADCHGYGIIQAVERATDGAIRLGAATLYRTLQRLLEQGYIVETNDRPAPQEDDERRRYYRITPDGREAARAEAHRLADLVRLAQTRGIAEEAL